MNNYYHLRTRGFISTAGQELHLQGELINSETKERIEVKIPMSDLIDTFTALNKDVSLNCINDKYQMISKENKFKNKETQIKVTKNNQSNTGTTEKQSTSEIEMPSLSQVHARIDLKQKNDVSQDNVNTNNEYESNGSKVNDEIVDPENPFEKEQIDDQLPYFTEEEVAAIDVSNKIRTEQNKNGLNHLNAGIVDDDDE